MQGRNRDTDVGKNIHGYQRGRGVEGFGRLIYIYTTDMMYKIDRASLVAQMVKNTPAVRETWVQSLGWEDPLEKGTGYPFQYSLTDFIFLGFRITEDGGCSHEIKRCLLLGRKAMTNLNRILKSRETLLCRQMSI